MSRSFTSAFMPVSRSARRHGNLHRRSGGLKYRHRQNQHLTANTSVSNEEKSDQKRQKAQILQLNSILQKQNP